MRKRIRGLMSLVALAAVAFGMYRLWRLDRGLALAVVAFLVAVGVTAACRDPAPPVEVSSEDMARGVEMARRIREDARRECAEYREGLRG